MLSSRDATTGRSGLGLLRDDVIRAPYRWLPDGLGNEYQWNQHRAGSSQARTTNSLRHRDYGPAATRGIFYPAHIGTGPLSQVIRHSTRRAPQPLGEAGLSSGSVSRRTRRRTEAGGPGGATGRDLILQRKHANVPFKGLGPSGRPENRWRLNAQRATIQSCRYRCRENKRDRELCSRVPNVTQIPVVCHRCCGAVLLVNSRTNQLWCMKAVGEQSRYSTAASTLIRLRA